MAFTQALRLENRLKARKEIMDYETVGKKRIPQKGYEAIRDLETLLSAKARYSQCGLKIEAIKDGNGLNAIAVTLGASDDKSIDDCGEEMLQFLLGRGYLNSLDVEKIKTSKITVLTFLRS
ncbi:MAG: hypothetical protein JXK16_10195 [Thiotrichales bacterium]|nr:hypothetical protein [Thiotrichales bacterium]